MDARESTAHLEMNMVSLNTITELDEEWVALILEDLESGISAEEIRNFLLTH